MKVSEFGFLVSDCCIACEQIDLYCSVVVGKRDFVVV